MPGTGGTVARRKIKKSKSVRACLWARVEAFLSVCIRYLTIAAFESCNARSFLSAFVSSLREDVNKTTRNLFAEAKRCQFPPWEHISAGCSLSAGNTYERGFLSPLGHLPLHAREYESRPVSWRSFVTFDMEFHSIDRGVARVLKTLSKTSAAFLLSGIVTRRLKSCHCARESWLVRVARVFPRPDSRYVLERVWTTCN